MAEVRVIQVVETTLLRRGKGIEGDPIRCIRQYWSLDGNLLAEVDPLLSGELTEPHFALKGVG
jgi:hypothetical protein